MIEGLPSLHLSWWNMDADVYVLRSDATGLIKIGHTRIDNAWHRARQVASAMHTSLDVLAVFQGPKRLERELHSMFAERRVVGEWFRADEDMLAFLMAMPSVQKPRRLEYRRRAS